MEQTHKILRAIRRSEMAYSYYLENKMYFQAVRIYKANKTVYSLLEEFLYQCRDEDQEAVCRYLFHLEDWFNRFETESEGISLNDKFAFNRVEGEIPFPSDFKNRLI